MVPGPQIGLSPKSPNVPDSVLGAIPSSFLSALITVSAKAMANNSLSFCAKEVPGPIKALSPTNPS